MVTIFTKNDRSKLIAIIALGALTALFGSKSRASTFLDGSIVDKKTHDTIRVSCWDDNNENCEKLQFWLSKGRNSNDFEKINLAPTSKQQVISWLSSFAEGKLEWQDFPIAQAVADPLPGCDHSDAPLPPIWCIVTFMAVGAPELVTTEPVVMIQHAIIRHRYKKLVEDFNTVDSTSITLRHKLFEAVIESIKR